MRFKLILEVNKKAYGNIIPINYQYEQSAAIYKILSYGDIYRMEIRNMLRGCMKMDFN